MTPGYRYLRRFARIALAAVVLAPIVGVLLGLWAGRVLL